MFRFIIRLSTLVVLLFSAAIAAAQQYLPIRLIRGEEIRSATSLRNFDDEVDEVTNRHVLALTFKLINGFDEDGDGSAEGQGGTTGTSGSTGGTTGIVEGGGIGGGCMTTGGSGGTTGTTGTTGGGTAPYFPPHAWIEVFSPAGMAPLATGAGYGPVADTVDSTPVLRAKILAGKEVTIHHVAVGVLNGGQVRIRVYIPGSVNLGMGNYTWSTTSLAMQEVVYDIGKEELYDASVDTRRLYGQPNREGAQIADANAELRNVNFGDWLFKGGLFVGNVPSSSKDKSGLSRIQLYSDIEPYQPRLAILSLFHLGNPSSMEDDLEIGLFCPDDEDTNLSTTESTVSWINRWLIEPRDAIPSMGVFEWNKDPWRRTTLGSTQIGEYVSFTLTKVYDDYNPSIYTSGVLGWATFFDTHEVLLNHMALAIHDEPNFVTYNQNAWKYFASREFKATGEAFPYTDCHPRLWLIDIDSTDTDTVEGPLTPTGGGGGGIDP